MSTNSIDNGENIGERNLELLAVECRSANGDVEVAGEQRSVAAAGRTAGKAAAALVRFGVVLNCLAAPLCAQIAVREQGFVPFREEPINYLADQVNDPVAELQQRIDRREVRLDYEPEHGYLKSVLKLLDVPVSSQTLVFSKTSFQYRKISPRAPRALYFNDNVYVAWVQQGHSLEIASFDPQQGAIFYLLEQQRSDEPAFVRATLDCTQCHVAPGTRGVPGVLLRSIYAKPSGTQQADTDSFVTGHESPLSERFGGWYVTGNHGRQLHMGNVFVRDPEHPEKLDRVSGANVVDLSSRFPTEPYLTSHSDIVAHLVLAHQTQMHNVITLANYRTRLALHADAQNKRHDGRPGDLMGVEARATIESAAEDVLRYLLFSSEVALDGPVRGTSTFAAEFAARGPRDPKGRSLRDFDLKHRIFKYPCSYLIYSEAFDSLPGPATNHVYRRLAEVLTERDKTAPFARLKTSDRRAILEILKATKGGLPRSWPGPESAVGTLSPVDLPHHGAQSPPPSREARQ